ncbi:hypothetical protein ABZ829_01040 [Streptomyces xanthochromogenes]|uniref:hypothetical protein n=1 Tax=Streptomyces xanthochromogenes TaxID=67384 RepID=UPI00341F3DC4
MNGMNGMKGMKGMKGMNGMRGVRGSQLPLRDARFAIARALPPASSHTLPAAPDRCEVPKRATAGRMRVFRGRADTPRRRLRCV